mmetsp:Transcript_54332/g.140328  ORF Transcript_54332/g.140328 Transcript_54332/m.140328 type:complete len:462 (-) Transcript_54332:607-1992(-)
MLAAESLALQSRLVQQLVAIKEREFDYVLSRYNAIAIQAALISEVAMSNLVSLTPPEEGEPGELVAWVFYISSMICAFSCVYVVSLCLYMGNWAPGLALRGPSGSLNHAFEVVMHERKQINFVFLVALFSMVVQTTASVWILGMSIDDPGAIPYFNVPGYSVTCTLLGMVAIAGNAYYLKRMKRRFFGENKQLGLTMTGQPKTGGGAKRISHLPEGPASMGAGASSCAPAGSGGGSGSSNAPSVPGASGGLAVCGGGVGSQAATSGVGTLGAPNRKQRRGSMIDNPLVNIVGANKDVGLGFPGMDTDATSVSAVLVGASSLELEMRGTLLKRVGADNTSGGASEASMLATLRRHACAASVHAAISSPWQPRFCVLRHGTLSYWHEEVDCDESKPASAEIKLAGYEILLDELDPHWGFELRPTIEEDGRRTWLFRARTEEERLDWVQRLTAQTFVGDRRSFG